MRVPALGPQVPRRGCALTRAIGRVVLALLGWRVEGVVPDIRRCVAIVAPHTSNWDFVVGLATILALGIHVRWLGKDTIFRGPFAPLLRWLGGIPVDRKNPDGVVDGAVAVLGEHDRVFLALSPEGTRRKVDRWKSGFYRIASRAGVPVFPVSLDYRPKVVGLGAPFSPTGDYEADLVAIQSRYSRAMARNPKFY